MVVVSNGPLYRGAPEAPFRGFSQDETDEQLLRSVLPTDKVVIEQNIPVLTLGGRRILFETGIGLLKIVPSDFRAVRHPPVIRGFVSIRADRLRYAEPPRTDNSSPANTTDATSAIPLRAGRVFPAFAAILIPASVLSKKSARLSMSV